MKRSVDKKMGSGLESRTDQRMKRSVRDSRPDPIFSDSMFFCARTLVVAGMVIFALPAAAACGSAAASHAQKQPGAVEQQAVTEQENGEAPARHDNATSENDNHHARPARLDDLKSVRSPVRPFDMDVLIERLKQTDAIGVFTKLAIRSDALDMMAMVKAYRRHLAKYSLKELRARFNGLLLKVLALLNDDPKLSRDIYLARECIWKSLLVQEGKT